MSIKARTLLPRVEVDAQGEQIDPRTELVDRLLEYKRYRESVDPLRELEQRRALRHGRDFDPDQFAPVAEAAAAQAEWESVSLYALAKAFERVLARQRERGSRPRHRVVRWPYTVPDQAARILRAIERLGDTSFADLFGECENRVHAVVTFLALLELLNARRVGILRTEGVNDLVVRKSEVTQPAVALAA